MKPSGILNFENVPADAGDPDVKVYVNGSEVEIGGGGDSDFTTAVMTVADYEGMMFPASPPQLFNEEGNAGAYVESSVAAGEYTIVLYKGKCLFVTDCSSVTVTGNATFDDGFILATGDFSVTEWVNN